MGLLYIFIALFLFAGFEIIGSDKDFLDDFEKEQPNAKYVDWNHPFVHLCYFLFCACWIISIPCLIIWHNRNFGN